MLSSRRGLLQQRIAAGTHVHDTMRALLPVALVCCTSAFRPPLPRKLPALHAQSAAVDALPSKSKSWRTKEGPGETLIAGGGPTGVTLALLLARQGVSVIVAEKEAEIYPLPRAAHLDHEIIRVFQEVGAAEAIVRSSRQSSRYDFLNGAGEILLRFTGSDRIGPGGWPAANMIHQPSVERVLRDRLADYPAARLEARWEVLSFAEDAGGVVARVA